MAKKIYGSLSSDRANKAVSRTGKREVTASVTYGDYGATTDGSVGVLANGKILLEVKSENSIRPAALDACYNAETDKLERLTVDGLDMLPFVKLAQAGATLRNYDTKLDFGMPIAPELRVQDV